MLNFNHLNLLDRYTLLESLPYTFKVGMEIGVWQGWYTAHMIQKTRMKIYAVDPWCATESYPEVEEFDPLRQGPDGYVHQEARYQATIKLLSQFPRNRYEIIRSYSDDVSKFRLLEDHQMDFVYIDGEHTYEAVRNDIEVWWPKVKSGGILSGHDYNDTNPGTVKAVNEFASKNNLKFKITGTNPEKGDADAPSWVFVKD